MAYKEANKSTLDRVEKMDYEIYWLRSRWYAYWGTPCSTRYLVRLGETVFADTREECMALLNEVKEDRRKLIGNQTRG